MGRIVVEKVTQLDDALNAFFDEQEKPVSSSTPEESLARLQSLVSQRVQEGPLRTLPAGFTVERVVLDRPMELREARVVDAREFCTEIEVEEGPDTICKQMAQDIASPDTTLFAARDTQTGKVLATVVLAKGESSYYKPIGGFLHSLQALSSVAVAPLGSEGADTPADNTPANMLQIECLMTDKKSIPFTRVPELMKRLGEALQNEIAERKPDIVYALTENRALPALLEHVAPKLAVRVAGKPSPVYQLQYTDDHRIGEPLGLTVMALNPAIDLSHLSAFETRRGAQIS